MEIRSDVPDSVDTTPDGDSASSASHDGGSAPLDLTVTVHPGGFERGPDGGYVWVPRDVTNDPDWERLFDAERG